MARVFGRRLGPVGLALTAYDIWRRLPPYYKRQLIETTRMYGPQVAKALAKQQRRLRKRPR